MVLATEGSQTLLLTHSSPQCMRSVDALAGYGNGVVSHHWGAHGTQPSVVPAVQKVLCHCTAASLHHWPVAAGGGLE